CKNGLVLQFSHPDITKADGISVILQPKGSTTVRLIRRMANPACGTLDFHMVLNQHAVMKYGNSGWRSQLSFIVKSRRRINNVVGLPFPRTTAGVNQRNNLLVNRSRLTIGIGFIFIGIEDLNFITLLQENSAIPASLTFFTCSLCRTFPLKV